MKIVTVAEMRSLEAQCEKHGVSTEVLMEKAGLAVADHASRMLSSPRGARVLVLVGPGNNGGDGLVAARYLSQLGARVSVYLCAPRKTDDSRLTVLEDRGVPYYRIGEDPSFEALRRQLDGAPLVIDAVLGTGVARPLRGRMAAALRMVAQARSAGGVKVLAVDLPTGLNADTGKLDPATLPADVTLTLGCPKVGHFTFPGPTATGRLEVADIGIPPGLDQGITLELITPELVRSLLPARPMDAHKGTFGKLLALAGSRSYVGAAYLAASSAYRVGAGLVNLATPQGINAILATKLTEAIYLPLGETPGGGVSKDALGDLREALGGYDTLLAGCGMGQEEESCALLSSFVLDTPAMASKSVVLDADALNALAQVQDWPSRLKARAVLTPHAGEMARLLASDTARVQSNRLAVVREAAGRWGQVIVLKGAYTLVAAPDGTVRLNPFANPAMSTAGTGDVLAGAIGGLLAQGLAPYDAATCAVYLHAAAGEALRSLFGDAGMLASDLLPELPKQIRTLMQRQG